LDGQVILGHGYSIAVLLYRSTTSPCRVGRPRRTSCARGRRGQAVVVADSSLAAVQALVQWGPSRARRCRAGRAEPAIATSNPASTRERKETRTSPPTRRLGHGRARVASLLRRPTPATTARRLAGHIPAVTFATIGELTKWTLVRHGGPRSLAGMRTFLAGLVVLPYDQARVRSLGANCRRTPSSVAGHGPSTTPGSPPAASSESRRSPRSAPRTSPTSPSTRGWRSCLPSGRCIQAVPKCAWVRLVSPR
jgi:hypothetical protein